MRPSVHWGYLVAAGLVVAATLAVEVTRRLERGPWAPATVGLEPGELEGPAPSCGGLRAYLEREAGESIDPQVLRAAAQATREELELRLDQVAAEVLLRGLASGESATSTQDVDWRDVFATLALDAPTTVEETLELYRTELASSEAFVRQRQLVELPRDPVFVAEVSNPILAGSFPLALYLHGGRLGVITRSEDTSSTAYLANHCRVCIPPLAVHEGVPGHHVAFSLGVPVAPPGGSSESINHVVQEGWALYGEVLMGEEGYWADDPARELGALRMIFWRATRALVDAELHCGELSRADAEDFYRVELGMTADAAATELSRHLLAPGTKASYFVGASQIHALRSVLAVDRESLAEFHNRLLRDPLPIPQAARERFGLELPPFDAEVRLLWRKGDHRWELVF